MATSTDDNAADGKIGSAVLLIVSDTVHYPAVRENEPLRLKQTLFEQRFHQETGRVVSGFSGSSRGREIRKRRRSDLQSGTIVPIFTSSHLTRQSVPPQNHHPVTQRAATKQPSPVIWQPPPHFLNTIYNRFSNSSLSFSNPGFPSNANIFFL